MSYSIGILSDTHGLIRPEALAALRGCELIVHAGDIGRPEVLDALRRLAPVAAIRGNVDRGAWAKDLPERETVRIDGLNLYVLHNLKDLAFDPRAAGFRTVISGHSHRPKLEENHGVLYFNPGSAGPRRFKLPITVGRLLFADGELRGEIVELAV
jgi:putative phosphoesterase